MSRSAVALAALAMLTGSLLAVPVAPAPRIAYRPVLTLIQALGSPEFAEREAASHELDLVGPPALPELQRELSTTSDPEVFRRASQLIARFEKRQADALALTPRMVEIDARDETLEQIAAELSKQTGFEVLVSVPGKKVSLSTGPVSFWDAIEQLNDVAELQIASVGGIKASKSQTGSEGTSTIKQNRISDFEVEPLPKPAAEPVKEATAKIEQIQKDLEKIAKARAEVAKEVNATARARAAALERIKAEAELKLRDAERDLILRKKGIAPLPPAPIAKAVIPAPSEPAPPLPSARNPANAIVLEPRQGAKRPSTNFGAVRLEAMPMPASAAVPDAVAALVQVWTEPRFQWQQARGVRVRQAMDAHGQALLADTDATIAMGPTVINGNGVQMVNNVNGGVVIINNGGGNVVINGQINGQVIVNNGNVVIGGNTTQPTAASAPNSRQVVVKLQPGDKETDSLRELSGVLEAVVKVSARDLVRIDDLSKPSEARHPNVRLKSGGLVKGDDGRYSFDVELEFNPSQVQPASPSSDPATGGTRPLPGRGRLIYNGSGPVGSSSRVFYGLQVTDEAGQPMVLQAQQTSTTQLGGALITMKFSFKIHRDSKEAPEPKTLRFWGSHSASVDIPFHLVNVPALAATK